MVVVILALDTETHPISTGQLLPKLVCVSVAYRTPENQIQTELMGNDDLASLEASLYSFLTEHTLVTANGAFDLGVIASAFPGLMPEIFEALAQGNIHDVQIREKLINLGTHGKLDEIKLPDGNTEKLSYSLAGLVLKHLWRDRSEEKASESSWRLNYCLLDGVAAENYPPEASKYAKDDAADTLQVWKFQNGKPNLETEWLNVAADFALKLMSAWGMPVDQEAFAEVKAQVEAVKDSGVYEPLFRSGILAPAIPPRPHKNGATHADGTPKMTKPKGESVKKAMLQTEVFRVCKEQGLSVKLAPKGKENLGRKHVSPAEMEELIGKNAKALGWVSTDNKFLPDLAPHSELIELYELRQSFQKLKTSVFPMLEGEERIYPNYDVLKETGRTSSWGSDPKKTRGEKGNLYPSLNIQQQGDLYEAWLPGSDRSKEADVIIHARRMYAPKPGRIFIAADYSSLELCAVGQANYKLFGKSKHRDHANEGIDHHAFLGAQIAFRFHQEWRDLCLEDGIQQPMELYRYFQKAKSHESKRVRKFYKKYRTLAKPVGLGYPGGLGPETMATLAWDTYKVRVPVDEARKLRDLWYEVYPEMRQYFDWLNGQVDPKNPTIGKNEDGKPIQGYTYTTPLGMRRRGATFCAAANGRAMQSPSAEGAKIALFELARECYDSTMESVLLGARPCAFIHDEIIMEAEDDDRAHDRAIRLQEIMEESMSQVMPDVKITAEPLLMRRWHKDARPVFGEDGRLIPWDFKKETVA